MLDFVMVSARSVKRGEVEIYPKFIIKTSSDLMIRGSDFYAIWDEDAGLWSTSEEKAVSLIDRELDRYAKDKRDSFADQHIKVLHLWDSDTGQIDKWHRYVQKQLRDHFHPLDERLVFSNETTTKGDYASHKLPYPLEKGSITAYDKLIGTLYSPEERHKIEWAIGAIVTGDSKQIQKFLVMYGSAGTGKSTILNIIQELTRGYYSVFDARALGSASNVFALEAFKSNPLVAIQHDGDLSHIEDNTRLNSVVSHEMMTVNEKFKSAYANRFNSFLFMGTNKPVRITDAKSGILRRLIDVSPSGKKIPREEYDRLIAQIPFELPGIAWHCREVYRENPNFYNDYVPVSMMGASNDFYNFITDNYDIFKEKDGITLKAAWELYKTYCEDARVNYPYPKRAFGEELKNYFHRFEERAVLGDTRVRSYYSGFITDKFESEKQTEKSEGSLLSLTETVSLFDKECAEWPAQYAGEDSTPLSGWDKVHSRLKDIDTRRLHYVFVPEGHKNHIVIDFDLKDKDGNKSKELNLREAAKWPPTYAELSKGEAGVHLHYIYTGDVSKLSRIYAPGIEIKVFTGNSSIRRKLTLCNNLPITEISSGLPLKENQKMVNFDSLKSERTLRTMIAKNLNKECHPATTPSINFIAKLLSDAYNSGMHYDVSDMRQAVLNFAARSSHQAAFCIKQVGEMKFKSEEPSENKENYDLNSLVFFDVEVFPNLFLINWKREGEGRKVVRMINPTPEEVENLVQYKLVGFNCRRYDNHILYARMCGADNEALYNLSQRIVSGKNDAMFGEAYNLSYTDVYDFSSKKQSLKKFEIELGIHHQELGLKWNEPVPEELWEKVAEYCDNDVLATEAVFRARQADWTARVILSQLSGLTVNDTTNQHTTRIIFGTDRNPQGQFNYRDLGKPVPYTEYEDYRRRFGEDYIFRVFNDKGEPTYQTYTPGEILPDGYSILPFFPGYVYSFGKSTYREEEVGEGGYVYAEPGIYRKVGLDDIASMHPHSLKAEKHFGKYTKNFEGLINARIAIKHGNKDALREIMDGKLLPFYETSIQSGAAYTPDDLSYALKIAINSVYGLTSAKFKNAFRDPRNDDNIVAKRGALFMINLKHAVQEKGYTVAHIKTDSIKVPNVTKDILDFIEQYGKEYGYTFEHEATYDRICLVNDAVYIAKYDKDGIQNKGGKHAGEWTATGTQFQVPYVFKTLFSKEPIEFRDMCETKSASTALYLDMNEALPDVSAEEKALDKLRKSGGDPEEEQRLQAVIDNGHDYKFIGKVGSFCPIKPGCGGGVLLREGSNGRFGAAGGSKGYRWMEAEKVKAAGKESDIDVRYYTALVDTAIETIGKYGDFEGFCGA